MMNSKCGVTKLMKENFPSITLSRCANHRLELSVGGTMKQVTGIDGFKAFIGKIYVV
jgi:hypothetical protein